MYFIHLPDLGNFNPNTPIKRKGRPTPIPNNNILEAAVKASVKENVGLAEAIPMRMLTTIGPTQAEDKSPALIPIKKVDTTLLLFPLALLPEKIGKYSKSADERPSKKITVAIRRLVTGKCNTELNAPPVKEAITPNKKYIAAIPEK